MASQEKDRFQFTPKVRQVYSRAKVPQPRMQELEGLRRSLGREKALVGRDDNKFEAPVPRQMAQVLSTLNGDMPWVRAVVMETAALLDKDQSIHPANALLAVLNTRLRLAGQIS